MAAPLKPVTVRDVAAEAGVSRSTASRVISGEGYVAADVRDRVRAAAQRLGYVPNTNARSLRKRDSNTIGLVISELSDPFYAELAAKVSSSARAAGYRVALVDCGGAAEEAVQAIDTLLGLRIMGALVTPFDRRFTDAMIEHQIPVVEVDRVSGSASAGAVVVDNAAGAREATKRLLLARHRNIAIILDETDWSTGAGRLAGYQEALTAAGITPRQDLVISCGFSSEEAAHAVGQFLDTSGTSASALFAANNVVAEGAWRELRRRRISVPQDVSFVAFDDAVWMSMVEPPIDSVRQPVARMGEEAVRLLLELAHGGQSNTITLPTSHVSRSSIRSMEGLATR